MSNPHNNDDLLPEYDFSEGLRGKHHETYRKGTNLVLLDPDVAKVFKDSESVNHALRFLIRLAADEVRNNASDEPRESDG
jgi:hypothetical protein